MQYTRNAVPNLYKYVADVLRIYVIAQIAVLNKWWIFFPGPIAAAPRGKTAWLFRGCSADYDYAAPTRLIVHSKKKLEEIPTYIVGAAD